MQKEKFKINYENDDEEELVHRTVADLVGQFVARKKDYLFTANQLEKAITTGQVTKTQIVAWFAEELEKYFP